MRIEFIIIILHILLILSYSIFVYFGKAHFRKEQMLPMFILPIFGSFMAIVTEIMLISKQQGSKPIELENLTLGDEILWVTLKSFDENKDIVPLEEAILINDVHVRRKFMLETLYSDPLKFLDVLSVAKYNDDVETSHYATTTISKVQKDFQLSIQKLAVEIERNPEDQNVLDLYIETLEEYISSGLLEEHLLRNLRLVLSRALERRLDLGGVKKTMFIKKLENCIKLGEIDTAFEVAEYLIGEWDEDERVWISYLHACVDARDGERLKEVLSKMLVSKINWTRDGKESIKFWMTESSTQ